MSGTEKTHERKGPKRGAKPRWLSSETEGGDGADRSAPADGRRRWPREWVEGAAAGRTNGGAAAGREPDLGVLRWLGRFRTRPDGSCWRCGGGGPYDRVYWWSRKNRTEEHAAAGAGEREKTGSASAQGHRGAAALLCLSCSGIVSAWAAVSGLDSTKRTEVAGYGYVAHGTRSARTKRGGNGDAEVQDRDRIA